MVADAINVLATEAKAEGAMLASATMGTPNDNNVSETQINLRMTSKDRKDTYFFIYSLDGKLISWRNSLDPIED